MGQISLRVGERSHMMSCRDGEEEHLLRLAAMIDRKCNEATTALGVMPEPRLLLTAALLIADELAELTNRVAPLPPDEHAHTRRLDRTPVPIEHTGPALHDRTASASVGVHVDCPLHAFRTLPSGQK